MVKIHLSRILGERRITQKKLSEMTGISQNSITKIYHEKVKGIDFNSIEKICTALDIEIKDLLEIVPGTRSDDDGTR